MSLAIPFLLRRYLLPREGNILSFALWISVLGVVLGMIQLMLVLSVMSGMQEFLKGCYTRITSDLVLVPKESMKESENLAPKLEATEHVKAVSPFGFGQGLVIKGRVGGVTLEGIDLTTSERVTPWKEIWQQEPLWEVQKQNPHWIWLGVQLAQKLEAKPGDQVTVFIPGERAKVLPFTVTAITKFGIYEHDMRYARVSMETLKELLAPLEVPSFYKIKIDSDRNLDSLAQKLFSDFGGLAIVKKWSEVNQNLFRAVEHQKWLLFLVLEIVIGLAAMNVVNLLMMSTHHRRRDIAILRAMGMRFGGIFTFFLVQGAAVGVVGIGLGMLCGVVVCKLFERFQPSILQESIYNVTRLPVQINLTDVLAVAVGAFVLCVVFSAIPALRAAAMKPVNALRNE